ncbi:MAG TPA: aldehyde ferredoxin oxidoreductase family protein [Dehalococcoidales bacterium]|nr:aldehyde ferredoxin oxidoreductase family protein [Dehalococcoidales bacterium]
MENSIPGGYTGRILRVDLSSNTVTLEKPAGDFYRKYLGGSGLIAYYLLNELRPGVEPLSTNNKLIFASGPVTGTSIIGSGRNAVGAKSPLSGGIAFSQVGEYWGTELKRAGYDTLIIEGKAKRPVYLSINGNDVKINSARHLWGKTTKESQETLKAELGDEKTRIALIGPGGENLVSYACIMNGLFDAAGRGGLGAVMGSKNLKAITVRGQNAVKAADPARLKELREWYTEHLYERAVVKGWHDYGTGGPDMEVYEKCGNLPVRNWRDGLFPGVKKINAVVIKDTVSVGMDSCFGCPIRCKKKVQIEKPYRVDSAYGGPEYETLSAFGSLCGVDNLSAIAKANELCNAYSLDTISTGGTIAFAMECFEKGTLTKKDTGGIELKFGNNEAMLECIELIAGRRGLGALLAEGSAKVAKKIGKEAEEIAVHVKGVEPGQHDPRYQLGMGLGYMVNPHGADHCCNVHDENFTSSAGMKSVQSLGFTEPFPPGDIGPRKIALFRLMHLKQVTIDSLIMCHLAAVPLDYHKLAEITAAVTGWDTDVSEQVRISERIMTMARLFNTREGFNADDDKLPARFFQPRTEGAQKKLNPERMDEAKRYYYQLMGWDQNTGIPLAEKLAELGIG